MTKHLNAAALDQRFKSLAPAVEPADWERLVQLASERMLARLTAAALLGDPTPEQLAVGVELLGAAIVEYTNVVITTIAEGQLRSEGQTAG